MSARSPASDLLPVAAVGVAILALGGLLLLIGAGTSVGNPSEFDTWLVGVGLVLLLGAMLVVLIRAGPPAPKRAPPAAEEPEPAPAPSAPRAPVGVTPVPTRSESPPEPANPPELSRRAVAASPPPAPSRPTPVDRTQPSPPAREARAPPPPFRGTTSIPAQYEDVRKQGPMPSGAEFEWEEGELGMSLPFAASSKTAVPSPVSVAGQPGGVPLLPVGFLEMEVERLRERVHELERTGGPTPPPTPTMRLTPTLAAVPARLEVQATTAPTAPIASSAIGSRRECIGCGAGLPGGATDPLCWGCGRPLCSTCYWRAKEGPSAHTCPACFARSGSTAVSGGRASPDLTPTRVAANPRPPPATARR